MCLSLSLSLLFPFSSIDSVMLAPVIERMDRPYEERSVAKGTTNLSIRGEKEDREKGMMVTRKAR